jgi:LPS-assembly protein
MNAGSQRRVRAFTIAGLIHTPLQGTASMPKRPARHNGLPHALLLLVASIFCTSTTGVAEDLSHLDWVPYGQLDDQQKRQVGPSCGGLYLDPLAGQTLSDQLDQEPIQVDANGAQMQAGQTVSLQGQVVIRQGGRRLQASQMLYDKREDEAALTGGVEIRQPGALIRGQEARVNMRNNQAQFTGGEFVLHATHLRGSAARIEQTSDATVVLQEGQLTSCEPGNETWLLQGERLEINRQTAQGSGRNITVSVAGVPVFYTPYLIFPVGSQRQSGLLFPTLGSNNGGLDYAQPIYWNIAPNMDATFTPRYSAGHGALLESEVRYLHKRASNDFRLAFLPNDKGGLNPDEEALVNEGGLEAEKIHPFKGDDRWLVDWQHKGGFDMPWYSQVNYTEASDIDYLRDLSMANFNASNNTFLNQHLALGYLVPHWRLDIQAQRFQNLLIDLDDSYRQLPKINLTGQYQWGALGLLLRNEQVHFDHPQQQRLDGSSIITGQRNRLDYQLHWNKTQSYGFIKPALGVQALQYRLQDDNLLPQVDTQPQLDTHYASLDGGLTFERENGQQLFEPRLFYLYRAFTDHSALYGLTADQQAINFDTTPLTFGYEQLFRDRRFAGGDRLDDANHLAISFTGRFLDENYQERLSASLGQLVYFNERRVFLDDANQNLASSRSDLAGQIKAAVNDNLDARTDLLYSPSNQKLMRLTTGLNFRQASRLYNLGYRFVRENEEADNPASQTIDQLDLSLVQPINPQWTLMARSFYDIDGSKPLDTFTGVEYNDCCYTLRVLARRWLDSKLAALASNEKGRYDQGLFFEVELKGLGSSGKRIHSLLQDSIPGFTP